jgi:hypothetical protein
MEAHVEQGFGVPRRYVLSFALADVIADVQHEPAAGAQNSVHLCPGLLVEFSVLGAPVEVAAVVFCELPTKVVGVAATHASVLGVMAVCEPVAVRR